MNHVTFIWSFVCNVADVKFASANRFKSPALTFPFVSPANVLLYRPVPFMTVLTHRVHVNVFEIETFPLVDSLPPDFPTSVTVPAADERPFPYQSVQFAEGPVVFDKHLSVAVCE